MCSTLLEHIVSNHLVPLTHILSYTYLHLLLIPLNISHRPKTT